MPYFSPKVKDTMKKLGRQFYQGKDVVALAKALLGKLLVTRINGKVTKARIVETEAYIGLSDRASHSFNGKRTARNEHMYAKGGTAYVYICYGMHHLFNVVTNDRDIPDAILIRAVEPLSGIELMLKRTGKKHFDNTLTKGPGNVAKALGISKMHSGISLHGNDIHIIDDGTDIPNTLMGTSPRIGVESAGDAAWYPYRFYVKGNRFVSGYPNK